MPNSTDHAISLRAKALVVALILLGAFPRLYAMDLVSITSDEGYHGMISMWFIATFNFEMWPTVGYPSVGVRNSALFMYLLALPNFAVWHPLSGAVFIALLNVGGLYLTWRLAWKRFGVFAANIALALMAFSPWSILYARQMWPPSCLVVFTLPFIGSALQWLDHGGRWRLFGLVLGGFIIPQVHFSGFCAPVWLLAALLLGRKKLAFTPIVAGAVLGLATWLPWVSFQYNQNWQLTQSVAGLSEGKVGAGETISRLIDYFQSLLHHGSFDFWFARSASELPAYFPAWLRTALPIVAVLLVLAFVGSLVWACRKPADRSLRLLALWSVLPVVLLAIIRPNVYPHYVLVAYPVPFILIGGWCQALIADRKPWLVRGIAGTLVFASLIHLSFVWGWYRYVDDDQLNGTGQYQLSYRQRRDVALALIEESRPKRRDLYGPAAGLHPPLELVYRYEQFQRGMSEASTDESHVYWVEEPAASKNATQSLAEKEQAIMKSLIEFRDFLPGWRIQKHWQEGPSHVYLLERGP